MEQLRRTPLQSPSTLVHLQGQVHRQGDEPDRQRGVVFFNEGERLPLARTSLLATPSPKGAAAPLKSPNLNIINPLKALQDVGIGYITLGQSTATLSGGGTDGGEVVFAGTPEDILTCEQSKTGKWIGKMM